ncbi:MAG: TolC family protein [Chitinophagaceae bacterium]|nr:TolC family protein [Chitinophagaceae bacterium]
MKKFLIILVAAITLSSAGTQAQDRILQNLPQQWSLQDCIEYAKKNNIQINTLRLNTSSAEQDVLQSKAARLPSVSASLSQSVVNGKQTDVVVGGLQSQANFSGNYGINSSVTLYNGGYLKNDIAAKQISLQSANLSVQEAQNDITLNITESFLNILLAQETITYLEDVLVTSQAQLKQGQQRYDAGSISKKDFLQFEAQTASDEYNLVNAKNNYRLNLLTLKQTLQLPSSYDFKIAIPDSIIVQELMPNLAAAQDAAQATRPEVKNDQLGIDLANINLLKARAGVLPTVSLGANLASGYANLNASNKYFTQINNNFYQSLGLTVSIPIYSKRVNKTNIEKSKIAIEQAKLTLADTKLTLNGQVEQAYINVQNRQAQYTAAERQMNASQESYDITNEQLRLGAVNMVELLQQKNLYVQALQSYIQAKYSAILYNKIYNFYTGVPVSF